MNFSELVDVLLLDGVDSHAHIDHPVVLAWRKGVGSLVVETVVSVEVHESVSKSDFGHGRVDLFELQIVKEVVDGLDAIFGAENGGRAVY